MNDNLEKQLFIEWHKKSTEIQALRDMIRRLNLEILTAIEEKNTAWQTYWAAVEKRGIQMEATEGNYVAVGGKRE